MATTRKQGDYAVHNNRLSKEDLYVLLALFMEDFPLETEEGRLVETKYRKVGAALVLPNDKIFAIDCSRNGVHGVARLLMEHQDVVKDCKIFVSRKPCSFCTKLLVQSKVKEIFYLPIEPEYHQDGKETNKKKKAFKDEKLRVDELFRVSAISQKVFVPGAGLTKKVKNKQIYEIRTKQQQTASIKTLLKKYWHKKWLKVKNVKDNLPWPSFDKKMGKQINADFKGIMAWAAKIALIPGSTNKACKFQRVSRDSNMTDQETFDPESNETDSKQAAAFITLARFLAERTDDPKTGVGAVIVDKNRKVVGLGWNGFPTKAVYGQFPRASDKDKSVPDKKYPYIIHAEQNALLMRNTKSITGGILFVTRIPCHECTPLLEMQGIKTVVLGTKLVQKRQCRKRTQNGRPENKAGKRQKRAGKQKNSLDYRKFEEKMKKGKFHCFEMKKGW